MYNKMMLLAGLGITSPLLLLQVVIFLLVLVTKFVASNPPLHRKVLFWLVVWKMIYFSISWE